MPQCAVLPTLMIGRIGVLNALSTYEIYINVGLGIDLEPQAKHELYY